MAKRSFSLEIEEKVWRLAERLAAREHRPFEAIIAEAVTAYAAARKDAPPDAPSSADPQARAVGPEDEARGGHEAPGGPGPTVPGLPA